METAPYSLPFRSVRSATRPDALTVGALAGPVFVTVAVAQMLVRPGFDISVHPISALSLGSAGWVQIANFVAAGLVTMVTAAALRRRMRGTPGGAWGPLLVGVFGLGMALAGVFVTDPALGFPIGTPDAMPEQLSGSAIVHNVAAQSAFAACAVAAVVFAFHYRRAGRTGLAQWSMAVPVLLVVVMVAPVPVGMSIRLLAGTVVLFAWLSTVCATAARRCGPQEA